MKAERIASRFSISHRDAELFVHGLSERSSCALDSVLVALVPEFNPLGQYDQVVAFVGRHNDDNEIGSSDDNEMVFS